MVKSSLMFFAESVIRDVDTNTISVFNIIEVINSIGFPALLPKLCIFNLLERSSDEASKYTCHVKLTINESELLDQPIDIDFGVTMRNRIVFALAGLAIPQPGILEAKLLLDGHELNSYKIQVNAEQSKKTLISGS